MLHLKRTFSYEYPPEESDIALIGIPFDSTQIGFSVRFGPLFIREAIRNLVGYDPETRTNIFRKLKSCDLGDVEIVPGNWSLTNKAIQDTLQNLLKANRGVVPVFLGGEHLITLGILQSLSKLHEKITVIHFDAHRDLLPDWMGERYSHITWAHHIAKDPKFELVQTGPRSWSEEEQDLHNKLKIKETIEKTPNPVYITVDLDVFDPSHAPEVGTPEPNGLSPEDIFAHLKKACENNLIGFDIVECSSQSVNTRTALLGAQVFKKILAYHSKVKQ
jgi:agmatinase